MSKKQTEKQKAQISKTQTAGILLSIEMESNFKLYSYRIITPENFDSRIKQLISIYKLTSAPETDPNQTSLLDGEKLKAI